MELMLGQIVRSLKGHDMDELYIISRLEENYAYLTDGKLRMLDNPKKKKFKHLELLDNTNNSELINKFKNFEDVSNSDIREAIENYKKN
ncbi:MAG: KOW domain-containing RNA-binding protein [Clostridia bacterium]|nr:KOW domain-containing RNA-binding protein [Clostridia bacterium]